MCKIFYIWLPTETFTTHFAFHLFPIHDLFLPPAIRLSDATTARLAGDVELLSEKDKTVIVKKKNKKKIMWNWNIFFIFF